jgi:hypothetical protein
MDIMRKMLERISKGHATTHWGLVIMRIGDRYTFGETINIRDKGLPLDEAVLAIYTQLRQPK